jgi:hypothetical protein
LALFAVGQLGNFLNRRSMSGKGGGFGCADGADVRTEVIGVGVRDETQVAAASAVEVEAGVSEDSKVVLPVEHFVKVVRVGRATGCGRYMHQEKRSCV